jgi:hypothetical protein
MNDLAYFEQPVKQTVADIPPINNLAERSGYSMQSKTQRWAAA